MYSLIGRAVVWGAVTLGAEYLLRKSGVIDEVKDMITKSGKEGSRQTKRGPGAIDKLSGKEEPKNPEDNSDVGC